jgi:hypothetical protein
VAATAWLWRRQRGDAAKAAKLSPSETGRDAARELVRCVEDGGCVDRWMQDQLIPFMALADDSEMSEMLTGELTLHTRTAVWVAERMTGCAFQLDASHVVPEPLRSAYPNPPGMAIHLPGLASYAGFTYRRTLVDPVHNTAPIFLRGDIVPFRKWMMGEYSKGRTPSTGHRSFVTHSAFGRMGVRRPFRPGGMDDDDDDHDCNEKYGDDEGKGGEELGSNPFLSEEATRNARRALAIGSRRAHDEGILISAPPGVSFAVGLRYEDVFVVDPHGQPHLPRRRSVRFIWSG